jgi:hypothetical protein
MPPTVVALLASGRRHVSPVGRDWPALIVLDALTATRDIIRSKARETAPAE